MPQTSSKENYRGGNDFNDRICDITKTNALNTTLAFHLPFDPVGPQLIVGPVIRLVMYIIQRGLYRLGRPAISTPRLPIRSDTYIRTCTVNKKLCAAPRLSLASGLCVRLAGKRAEVSPRYNLPRRRSLLFLGSE
jgi:hypothetical protein